MKWIGRILYIAFVILILFYVEFQAGGANAFRQASYTHDTILNAVTYDEDGKEIDFDTYELLKRYNAAYDIHYAKAIENKNGELSYDTTTSNISDVYKIKFSIHPLVSMLPIRNTNMYHDGFYIVLEEGHEDVLYYEFEFVTFRLESNEPVKEILSSDFLKIYQTVESYRSTGFFPNLLLVSNYTLNTHNRGTNIEYYEYDIRAIDVYAYTKKQDSNELEKTFIYRTTDGSTSVNNLAGSPIVTDSNLKLTSDTYNITKNIYETGLTDENILAYGIVTDYHPADLSPYNYYFFVIYGLYAVLILVIPYFWFFHRPLMAKIKKNKRSKLEDPNHEPLPQIFSDDEPKSDNE